MTTIDLATALIQKWEGFHTTAYQCPAGIWTIGWGRTGKDIGPSTTTSPAGEAKWLSARLTQDLAQVEKLVKLFLLKPTNQDRCLAALLSLVYNIGITNFKNSTLRRIINEGGPIHLIEKHWLSWNKAKGKELKGLTNRRKEEFELFKSGLQSQALS